MEVAPGSLSALRRPNLLSDKSDDFLGLIRRYEHPSKDASPPKYQDVLPKRPVHQVQRWVHKQRTKGDRADVRNIGEIRPPDTQFAKHHELDSIIAKPVFSTSRPQKLACSQNDSHQDQPCNHNRYHRHFDGVTAVVVGKVDTVPSPAPMPQGGRPQVAERIQVPPLMPSCIEPIGIFIE